MAPEDEDTTILGSQINEAYSKLDIKSILYKGFKDTGVRAKVRRKKRSMRLELLVIS